MTTTDPRPTPAALERACPRITITAAGVREARALANLSRLEAAAWLGITAVHLARIERGRAPARAVHVHVLLLVAGFIVAPAWTGWRFAHGELYAPGTWSRGYSPAHVLGAGLAHQLAHALRVERDVVTSRPLQGRRGDYIAPRLVSAGGASRGVSSP